jgi:hypothetical protein
MNKLPSQEELLQRYAYDPFTGNVYHRIDVSNSIKANTVISNKCVVGYLRTKINGKA